MSESGISRQLENLIENWRQSSVRISKLSYITWCRDCSYQDEVSFASGAVLGPLPSTCEKTPDTPWSNVWRPPQMEKMTKVLQLFLGHPHLFARCKITKSDSLGWKHYAAIQEKYFSLPLDFYSNITPKGKENIWLSQNDADTSPFQKAERLESGTPPSIWFLFLDGEEQG